VTANIVHVAGNPDTGVAKALSTLARAQVAAGLNVELFFAHYRTRRPPAWFDGLQCRTVATPRIPGTAVLGWLEIAGAIGMHPGGFGRAPRGTIYHFHDPSLAGALLVRGVVDGSRAIVTFHGMSSILQLSTRPYRRLLHARWVKRAMRVAHFVTSVDPETPQLMRRFYGFEERLVRFIPNAVPDVGVVRTPRTRELRVVHVSTMDENKGWRLTAAAVEQRRVAGAPVHLTLAGPGPDAAAARAWCEGRKEYACYLPWVNDVPRDVLPAADVLVLPSAHEGMPMVILEALAAGVPVVATRAGGVPAVIRDRREGLLVDRTSQAIAEALAELAEHPELCESLSANGRRRWLDQYRPEEVERRYRAVYDEALST
jgi:glycosyltransferase involved in cell wall biosynthesis